MKVIKVIKEKTEFKKKIKRRKESTDVEMDEGFSGFQGLRL
jgi:hypothetical protein